MKKWSKLCLSTKGFPVSRWKRKVLFQPFQLGLIVLIVWTWRVLAWCNAMQCNGLIECQSTCTTFAAWTRVRFSRCLWLNCNHFQGSIIIEEKKKRTLCFMYSSFHHQLGAMKSGSIKSYLLVPQDSENALPHWKWMLDSKYMEYALQECQSIFILLKLFLVDSLWNFSSSSDLDLCEGIRLVLVGFTVRHCHWNHEFPLQFPFGFLSNNN